MKKQRTSKVTTVVGRYSIYNKNIQTLPKNINIESKTQNKILECSFPTADGGVEIKVINSKKEISKK